MLKDLEKEIVLCGSNMTEEGRFQKRIKDWLDNEKIYNIKQNASALSKTGVPDRIILINTLFIGMEIKKDDTSKASDLQQYNIKTIKNNGGVAFVIRPNTFKKFKEITLEFLEDKNIDKYKKAIEKYMEVK